MFSRGDNGVGTRDVRLNGARWAALRRTDGTVSCTTELGILRNFATKLYVQRGVSGLSRDTETRVYE